MCSVMSTAYGRSGDRLAESCLSASIPPAEAPTAMTPRGGAESVLEDAVTALGYPPWFIPSILPSACEGPTLRRVAHPVPQSSKGLRQETRHVHLGDADAR